MIDSSVSVSASAQVSRESRPGGCGSRSPLLSTGGMLDARTVKMLDRAAIDVVQREPLTESPDPLGVAVEDPLRRVGLRSPLGFLRCVDEAAGRVLSGFLDAGEVEAGELLERVLPRL